MFCWGCLKRCFRREPVRDVSFIANLKERRILSDAISAVDALGWDLVRKGEFTEIAASMNLSLHNEDSLYSTIGLLSHMADNWDSWVEKRSARQAIDEKHRRALELWIRSHQYTEKTNNYILFSYLENLLRFIEDWSVIDRQGGGADDLIFAIECVIAKEEDKYDVYKKVISVPIPSDYELVAALMDKHREFIKDHDEKLEEQVTRLKEAIAAKDLGLLQKAIRDPKNVKKLFNTPEYIVAIGLEEVISEALQPLQEHQS
jgi:hypothetical protein